MNILKLMPNQYSMFHTTIPQGKVVSLDTESNTIQKGRVIDDLTVIDEHEVFNIKEIDSNRQKKSFIVLKPVKIKKIVLLIYKNTEQSMRFVLKSNGCSIYDIALVKPIFLNHSLNNAWVLPRMFNLFQEVFNYYEILFPFYLYCNKNDILERRCCINSYRQGS